MNTITKHQVLLQLNFSLALMVATEGLLLAARMHDRLKEEKDHARWLAQDIVDLGGTIGPYDYDAAAIAGAQYYHVLHCHPKMLLGYMAALECNIMTEQHVEELERVCGPLPCLKYHAKHDREHGAWVLNEINSITDEQLYGRVIGNKTWTEQAIAQALRARLSLGMEG